MAVVAVHSSDIYCREGILRRKCNDCCVNFGKVGSIGQSRPRFPLAYWPCLKQEASPASLAGTWSGSGIVVYPTGSRERARCQANYSSGSSTVSVNATCATPSGSVSQYARLRKTGANSYAGTFFNSQYNLSGSMHVVVNGNTQSVSIASGSGSASLMLKR